MPRHGTAVERAGRSSVLRDARRVIDTRDILCGIGSFMYRRSLRYSVLALAFGLLGYISSRLGFPGLTPRQAIGLPFVVGTTAFLGGLALKFIPNLISMRLMTVAEATDLNLMEDYRKSQAPVFLGQIWDRVFRHEADILYSEEEKREEQERIDRHRALLRDRLAALPRETLEFLGNAETADLVDALVYSMPLSDSIERTRDGFLISAMYAHRDLGSQLGEERMTGLALSYFEDWCDGAYFDRSDVKLVEQSLGDPTLRAIRREVRMPLGRLLAAALRGAQQKVWFTLVTRAMMVNIGQAVETLNARHDTTRFNAQVLLWPGSEDDPVVAAFPGAREDVLAERARILRHILGETPAEWEEMVDRMGLASFLGATELRMRYDPDYCDGSLGLTPVDDLREEGRVDPVVEAFVSARARGLHSLDTWLSERSPDFWGDRAARRAVRIAFHIDKDGFRDAVRGDSGRALELAEAARRREGVYSRRLVSLRLFHELCRIHLQSYRDLVRRLAGGAGPE